MTLNMSRPWKHPRTGVFWLRKRVPDELRAVVGKVEELQSLRTKDAEEAKRRFVTALAGVQLRWQNLRCGARELTERQAHELAAAVHDHWLLSHSDNPSEQFFWKPDWYDRLWTEAEPRGTDFETPLPSVIALDALVIPAMRRFCLRQADQCAKDNGLLIDEWSRFRLAKALGSAFQRASLELRDVVEGRSKSADIASKLDAVDLIRPTLPAKSQRAAVGGESIHLRCSDLLERWWSGNYVSCKHGQSKVVRMRAK